MNKEFLERVSRLQMELKAPKNQKNNFGGYQYRSCEDILEAAKPIAAKHGILIMLSDSVEVYGDRIYIKATASLTDIASGEILQATALAREAAAKKGMDDSQITGSASSYARKYALNGLLCIDDTKDADTYEPTTICPKCGNAAQDVTASGKYITAANFVKKFGECANCYQARMNGGNYVQQSNFNGSAGR